MKGRSRDPKPPTVLGEDRIADDYETPHLDGPLRDTPALTDSPMDFFHAKCSEDGLVKLDEESKTHLAELLGFAPSSMENVISRYRKRNQRDFCWFLRPYPDSTSRFIKVQELAEWLKSDEFLRMKGGFRK